MNELIQYAAEQGITQNVYSWVNSAAGIIAILYSLLHGKRLNMPLWKQFILLAIVYCGVGLVGSGVMSIVEYLTEIHFLGIKASINSIVRLFVFYPLFATLAALLLREDFNLACDSVVMYPLLSSAIGQLACIFPGCCRGYEWNQGIFNNITGACHFPTQIVETVLTFLIFFYLTSWLKGKKYESDGSLYPRMMILYGIMRFICELLRDNEKLLLGCSAISFHAIFIVIVGVVWMRILSNKKEKNHGHSIQTLQTEEGEACQGSENA